MSDMKYEALEFVPPESLESFVESGDPKLISKALYSATAHGDNWRWTQDHCLRFITSEHVRVRWTAAQCLGTLASLRHPIDADTVLRALQTAKWDPTIAGEADFSMDLVKEFVLNLRLATEDDIPALHALIEASVRGLQAGDYTPAQIEGALGTVLGLDTQLIHDQTYFVAETPHLDPRDRKLAGCGGWSKRKTLFGADRGPGRVPDLLSPATDAAKVRAIFVHPDFARRGLGTLILARVEAEAAAAGFRRYEMGSTLTGVPLYRLKGYVEVERIGVPLWNGEALPVVRMIKDIVP
jgi:GNAT superfamily N-acetyltransferase